MHSMLLYDTQQKQDLIDSDYGSPAYAFISRASFEPDEIPRFINEIALLALACPCG